MAVTQCDRILRHLKDYGSITPMEAMNEYGIMRLAARINDLRAQGIAIASEVKTGKNRYGEATHFSVYRLKKEEEIHPESSHIRIGERGISFIEADGGMLKARETIKAYLEEHLSQEIENGSVIVML